jgi:alcohol dehydrogenase
MFDALGDPMENHSFRMPDQLQYGSNATDALTPFASKGDVDKAILVTDVALVEAGVIDPVVTALDDADVSVGVYDGVVTEPKLPTVEALSERVQAKECDLIVGVGGGSCLDAAKVASVVADSNATVRGVIGTDRVAGDGLPLALLPTTAGTGSEVTDGAVLADPDDGGAKKVVISEALLADLALIDPKLTATLPSQIAASTGADALTHAIEAYVTTSRSPLTDILCQDAIGSIGDALVEAVHEESLEARYAMSLAATEAGLGFSNAGLGAVHALTYSIAIEYGIGHGLANAVMLPHVMAYNIPANPERFAEIARLLGRTRGADQSTLDFARESVDAVTSLLASVDLPSSLRDVGDVHRSEFERFANIAFEHSSHNIRANPRSLDRSDAITIFKNAASPSDPT